MKKKWSWWGCILLLLWSCNTENKTGEKEQEEEQATILYGFPIDDYRVVTDTVRNNETLSDILSRYNVSSGTIHNLAEKSKEIFDVRKIRPNHTYTLLFCSPDSAATPEYFIYENNLAEYVVYELSDEIRIEKETKPTELKTEIYGNTITRSLWNSFTDHGKSPGLAMEMADVYQWAIDFYAIQTGDAYKVMYTQEYVDGRPFGAIKIVAAEFVHEDSTYFAYRFNEGEVKGYFDEKGESLHKAFLKAPLKFSRISSRFSGSRMHPVLKYRRAHRGVDYAAPTGTPIRSIGDGKVVKKSYQAGGAGYYLKVKHNKTYTTIYMHMSKYAKGMKQGKRVKQGEIIGYVGMTGTATGPHLHFGVMKNGAYINPLSLKSPPKKPLSGAELKNFMNTRDSLQLLMSEYVPEHDETPANTASEEEEEAVEKTDL